MLSSALPHIVHISPFERIYVQIPYKTIWKEKKCKIKFYLVELSQLSFYELVNYTDDALLLLVSLYSYIYN